MHPPAFRTDHRLSDWPDCVLEIRCGQRSTMVPVKLLIRERGDRTFGELLAKLRCRECGRRPAPVYLCAGRHREFTGGPPVDWAIELVPRGARSQG